MKRRIAINWLFEHGCCIKREGNAHTVIMNEETRKVSTLPRHADIDENLFAEICKQLGIPKMVK